MTLARSNACTYNFESKTDNEKCYLVGLEDKSLGERGDDTKFTMEESLTELSELSGAAGLSVVGSTYQVRDMSTTLKFCIDWN